ncbi:hypothetical protein INS49_009338 [Diaporthe citri]|uniref:uncharacterized protein n=1 Tax=Diaporthe citri TaxID=83186 RepID=UPI001C800673|nr:uncharacterized protein INS49_009338 [Diaporthe citri]KAG6361114.1 hypothetical protein INS49_009338 [Diaporthe citri]
MPLHLPGPPLCCRPLLRPQRPSVPFFLDPALDGKATALPCGPPSRRRGAEAVGSGGHLSTVSTASGASAFGVKMPRAFPDLVPSRVLCGHGAGLEGVEDMWLRPGLLSA